MAYESWQFLLSERFPDRDAATVQVDWDSAKQRLAVGQTVCGEVVSKAPFGAWLDIGVGFPALLQLPQIADLTPERYHADQWCSIGSAQTVRVIGFNDPFFQVGVSQKVNHVKPPVPNPDVTLESN